MRIRRRRIARRANTVDEDLTVAEISRESFITGGERGNPLDARGVDRGFETPLRSQHRPILAITDRVNEAQGTRLGFTRTRYRYGYA